MDQNVEITIIKKVVKIVEENELSADDVSNVVSTLKNFKPVNLKTAIKNVQNILNIIDFIDEANIKSVKNELKTLQELTKELEEKLK